MADRIAVMKLGVLQQVDTPQTSTTNPTTNSWLASSVLPQ